MSKKKTLGSHTNPAQMSSRDHSIADGYTRGSYIDHALDKNKRGPRVTHATREHEKREHKAHKEYVQEAVGPKSLLSLDDDFHVEPSDPKNYGR